MIQTTTVIILFTFIFTPLILAEVARGRSMPSIEDFFICNRKLSPSLYFFTIYATWFSTFASMSSISYFYFNGPIYMTTFAWNALFAVLIFELGRRIWFYGKSHNYITPTDFFADIYNYKPLTLLISIILILFTLPYIQIQFAGGAYLIESASGGKIPWEVAGLLFYIIMVVYLWAGGLRAVSLTDVFFGLLIFCSMVGLGIFLVYKAGGLEHIFSSLAERDADFFTISKSNNDTSKSIMLWLSMFVVVPVGAIMTPSLWIRNYAAKKEKIFPLASFLIALGAAGYIGSMFAGNAGKVLDPNLSDWNDLVPHLISENCSQVLLTLFFCGFAAAALSTANSQIHSLSAIYTVDIHKRYIKKNAKDMQLLSVAKWAVIVASVITYSLMVLRPSIIMNTGLLALSGSSQIIVPLLGALFWKRSNGKAAFFSLLISEVLLLILTFVFAIESSFSGIIALVINATLFITLSINFESILSTREKIVNYSIAFRSRN